MGIHSDEIARRRGEYFAELHEELLACALVEVRRSDAKSRKHHYPEFVRNRQPCDLPRSGGVYLVYRLVDGDRPLYCGQSGNLYQRLEYHFSDDPDAIAGSTLKRDLAIGRRSLAAMSEDLALRFVLVPLGRLEFEEFLQKYYRINVRRDRRAHAPCGLPGAEHVQ